MVAFISLPVYVGFYERLALNSWIVAALLSSAGHREEIVHTHTKLIYLFFMWFYLGCN